jgi:hypothetical protein
MAMMSSHFRGIAACPNDVIYLLAKVEQQRFNCLTRELNNRTYFAPPTCRLGNRYGQLVSTPKAWHRELV